MLVENWSNKIIKYLLEGLAVAVAAYYIPNKNRNMSEVAMIALTASVTFLILDMFAPSVGSGARQGAGFGIGSQAISYTGPPIPPPTIGQRPAVGEDMSF